MGLKDFIVTPFVIFFIYLIGFVIRNYVTDNITKRYFFPALTLKIIGAISVGLIYQFYYGGGDTFTFHTHGSSIIWEAFMDSPLKGFKLFFSNVHQPDTYEYSSRILQFGNQSSLMIIKIAAVLDIFTFATYSATAVLFAALSFSGMWVLFLTFYRIKPAMHLALAVAIFFIPSVFFWGSGILKDTITLGALGWCTFAIYNIFIKKRSMLLFSLLLILNLYLIFSIKMFILLSFLPAAILWIFMHHSRSIKLGILNVILLPIFLGITVYVSFFTIKKISENDPRYALENLAVTAKVTAYDIRYYTGKDAGSGYSLGELDGTFSGMLRLAPAAVNVSLFRPYLWEIKNPLMMISSLEAFVLLILTVYVIIKARLRIFKFLKEPTVLFCLLFALSYAFAVGVSTYNFGSLVRYKIPMMPFYSIAIFYIMSYLKRERKLSAFESTE